MRFFLPSVTFVFFIFFSGRAAADDPCHTVYGAESPVQWIGSPCEDITYYGCCSPDGLVLWCEDGTNICAFDCSLNPSCGWNSDLSFYDCATSGTEDPSGANPLNCDSGNNGNNGTNDGCTVWANTGCGGCKCESCVCAMDSYCCQTQWDSICVDECQNDCGGCGANTCIPACSGKECGDDGCGGYCGTCPSGTSCQNYKCISSGGKCSASNSLCAACICSSDHDPYCCETEWDSLCDDECSSYTDCAPKCGGSTCTPNCSGKVCGSDGCGGSCGYCSYGYTCNLSGKCEKIPCQPDCFAKQCGSDGCGGSCGTCPSGEVCDMWNQCVDNGQCTPDCSGKKCGDNGCGGSCGTCPSGYACNSGSCTKTGCTPQCTGKQCGSDGCSGSCGTCPQGKTCSSQGICEAAGIETCIPDCSGKQCGSDGCNGACGVCYPPKLCNTSGKCYDPNGCQPDCTGKQCGDDGCGGTCGECDSGYECKSGGYCVISGQDTGKDAYQSKQNNCPDGMVSMYGTCTVVQYATEKNSYESSPGGGCAVSYPGKPDGNSKICGLIFLVFIFSTLLQKRRMIND